MKGIYARSRVPRKSFVSPLSPSPLSTRYFTIMTTLLVAAIAALFFAYCCHSVAAFQSHIARPRQHYATTYLGMVRFDKKSHKWCPTSDAEGPTAGYGIVGSLYRAGPVPFFQRVVNGDTYEQAVLKYMAQEKCDRKVC